MLRIRGRAPVWTDHLTCWQTKRNRTTKGPQNRKDSPMNSNRFSIVGRLGAIDDSSVTANNREKARFGIMPLVPSPFATADKQWFNVTSWDDQIGFLRTAKLERAQVEVVGTIGSYERFDALTNKKENVLSLSCVCPMRHQMIGAENQRKQTRNLVPSFRLVGSLGNVQAPRITPKGDEVGSFGIGLHRKIRTGLYGEEDATSYRTDFINITGWNDILAAAAGYRQSSRDRHYDYVVEGRLEMQVFTPKNASRSITRLALVATNIDIYTAQMRENDNHNDGRRIDDDNRRPDDDSL